MDHKPRGEAEIDVEFLDADDEPIGTVTAKLVVQVLTDGIHLRTEQPVDFLATGKLTIEAWRMWIGDQQMYSKLPNPPTLRLGDIYRLRNIAIPVTIKGDIDFGPGGGGGDKPKTAAT